MEYRPAHEISCVIKTSPASMGMIIGMLNAAGYQGRSTTMTSRFVRIDDCSDNEAKELVPWLVGLKNAGLVASFELSWKDYP